MIIDCHVHLLASSGSAAEQARSLLGIAARFEIGMICPSLGPSLIPQPSPEQIVAANDFVLEATLSDPERVCGFCWVSPAHVELSLAEMERCVARGPMRGLKAWVCRRCSVTEMDLICEYAAELGAPIQQHTWHKTVGQLAGESLPTDLAELAARHPRTNFLMAHCGGKWELGMSCAAHLPNVYFDLAGGEPERGQTEMGVRLAGAERVVYGSDANGRSFATQLAKVLGARVTESQKQLILAGNIRRLLGLS